MHGDITTKIINGQTLVVALGKRKGINTFGELGNAQTVFIHAKDKCIKIDVIMIDMTTNP